MARRGGSALARRICPTGTLAAVRVSSASRPASSPARSGGESGGRSSCPGFDCPGFGCPGFGLASVLAMATDLPSELFSDVEGHLGDGGVLDTARVRDADLPLAGDTPGPGGEQYDPLGEAYGFAHVVGDEQHGDT